MSDYEDFYEDVDYEDLALFFPKEDLSPYEDTQEGSPGDSPGDSPGGLREDSPGRRILKAVDTRLPSIVSLKTLSTTASCLVEDLSLLFPQLPIELGRATAGNNEVFVPIICDLQIFNSKGIGKFSPGCIRIPDSAILNGDTRNHDWYELLLEEISAALTDYTAAQLLVLGKTFSARTNFGFTIPPGGKQKVFTNFRLPRYEATVHASVPGSIPGSIPGSSSGSIPGGASGGATEGTLEETPQSVAFQLKNKIFYSGITNPPSLAESLEDASEHFPTGSLPRPGANRVACSNTLLLEWVDTYLGNSGVVLSDCCFDGLFSQLGERLKLTLVNNTEEEIVVPEGTEIATLVCSLQR